VLDPENPDAFFGLAEAEFHMGDKVNAKAHYEKVLEYDPEGKHAKAARKALKELGEGK
jgi:TolA-binding protein